MVVADNIIMEAIQALESLNLPIPSWIFKAIIVLIFLGSIYEFIIKKIFNVLKNAVKFVQVRRYSPDTKRFIDIRNIFVDHLDSEVKRLNREADWNDFYYIDLEAEVEIDPSLDFDIRSAKNPIVLLRSFYHIIGSSLGISPALKVQKNLIQAIRSSKSRVFLVIGDPGSGKTVSLRHLFLDMAKTCASSKNKDAVVPIYLNLKHLNMEPDKVDADRIHDWIIEQLRADQDRTIHDFLDINFEKMLKDGNFFFLFDSFDEIPAVMDAREEQEVVRKYAMALDRFLHSQHRCRGLVGSRPYRAPKTFIGQRMTIRPLSNKRIKNALSKYMGQELALAAQLWQELLQSREDMLYVAQNPFYLGLLARYAKEKHRLPERNYDLFERFIQTRAKTDENRLRQFGLTPNELVEQASNLAFTMTRTPHIGLEADIDQIREITNGTSSPSIIEPLLHALTYSKLGRLSREEPSKPRIFSFVHRRFHEYFCARYLKQNPDIAPFENLAADDRWREILVLLCEVLPGNLLTRIFDTARSALTAGINSDSGSTEHRKAIETIRFLRDGFHNRVDDIPNDIRVLCSKFIQKQLEYGNLLDKKRAIEGVSIVDNSSIHSILEPALTDDSAWLRDTAIKSCRILRSVSPQIAVAIRRHFFNRYMNLKIHQDYASYSALFTSPPALNQFKSFLNILIFATLLQGLLYLGIAIYGILFDVRILIGFLIGLVVASFFMSIQLMQNFWPESNKPLLNLNRYRLVKFRSIFNRFFDILPEPNLESSSDSNETLLKNAWNLLTFSIFFIIPFFNGGVNILLPILVLVLLSNGFLTGLVSNYPDSILAWLLYPLRILIKMIRVFKTLLFEILRNRRLLKILVFASLLYGFMFWIAKAVELAQLENFSFTNIYSGYGSVLATSIIFTFLIVILVGFLFAIGFLTMICRFILFFGWILIDQSRLTKLYFIADSRPTTALESINILHYFKSDPGKAQYVQALFKWLPVSTDSHTLIEEASKHHGGVSDNLYQLAEIWEDSLQRRR